MPEYLIEFPKIEKHPIVQKTKKHDIEWNKITDSLKLNLEIKPLDWIEPGEKKAMKLLERLKTSLEGYHDGRNDPTINKLSNLSPYFHHGHISPQRVALEISKSDLQSEDKKAFLEEMIVRRELADNFCHYEKDYDFFGGFHVWAQKTLNEHRNDEREYIYPGEQFEAGETHDPLWNAAQNEMKIRGKMILPLMVSGLLVGCATISNIWLKPATGSRQAEKDLRICADKAFLLYDPKGFKGKPLAFSSYRTYYWGGAQEPFESCMTSKGYSKQSPNKKRKF